MNHENIQPGTWGFLEIVIDLRNPESVYNQNVESILVRTVSVSSYLTGEHSKL